ncbi:hypothetical protein [Methylotenera mobilis]|uniref:Uncharacterized protein n=1 Tax=Methylotenera mobilis (strain JLW8 / ATCC BAA-1282 / DSM 17540) TaxID=583345 RepID=C6WTY6_METML|nr:hypothetical protein [Methylotenera mobilis]ACT47385.1 hypothetical protein Mmol_0475 [Methylotenera mobilis JLW8]
MTSDEKNQDTSSIVRFSDSTLIDSAASQKKFFFTCDNYWPINVYIFVITIFLMFFSFVNHQSSQKIFTLICMIFLIVRIFTKNRPPEFIELNYQEKILVIKHRFPNAKELEVIDIKNLTSAIGLIRPARYSTAELQLTFVGEEKKSIHFDVDTTLNSFFSAPKEALPQSLVCLINEINESVININLIK